MRNFKICIIITIYLFLVINDVFAYDSNNNSSITKKQFIFIISTGDSVFKETTKSLIEELEEEFNIKEINITENSSLSILKEKIDLYNPKILILFDNSILIYLRKFQKTYDEKKYIIPSISLMAVNVSFFSKNIKKSLAIEYEIPIVTSIVNFRQLVKSKIKKVGIIHRKFMNEFINKNRKYCVDENIEIINIELKNSKSYAKRIRKGIKKLAKTEKIDVIWVPNDISLLKVNYITRIWKPYIEKYKIPLIVGAYTLVNPELKFGIFAVIPDHKALGVQAAELVYELQENDWDLPEQRIYPPLSVKKILNYRLASKIIVLNEENLKNIDRILK